VKKFHKKCVGRDNALKYPNDGDWCCPVCRVHNNTAAAAAAALSRKKIAQQQFRAAGGAQRTLQIGGFGWRKCGVEADCLIDGCDPFLTDVLQSCAVRR
jgi:hypothetical protein